MKGAIIKENKERIEQIFRAKIQSINSLPFPNEMDYDLEWAMKVILTLLPDIPEYGSYNDYGEKSKLKWRQQHTAYRGPYYVCPICGAEIHKPPLPRMCPKCRIKLNGYEE